MIFVSLCVSLRSATRDQRTGWASAMLLPTRPLCCTFRYRSSCLPVHRYRTLDRNRPQRSPCKDVRSGQGCWNASRLYEFAGCVSFRNGVLAAAEDGDACRSFFLINTFELVCHFGEGFVPCHRFKLTVLIKFAVSAAHQRAVSDDPYRRGSWH